MQTSIYPEINQCSIKLDTEGILRPMFEIKNILSINKCLQVKILCMLLINTYFVHNCSTVSYIIQLHRANINSKKILFVRGLGRDWTVASSH